LLSNAVKFSSRRHKPAVEITAREEETEFIFGVEDNGAGFDIKHADRLFGVFQRFHTTEEFEGTGLGLAIVRRIILRHGGRIWAESERDKGAKFYFTLPRKAAS
ncbi:MAG: histidine kinase, partial [Verrucomicrobiales bacterium]|nr:histidine kinase [Verrucomicrobiales bacterium]